MTDESKKKRGRPPLTPEQKAMRQKKVSKPGISSTKMGGYASQRRYKENHPDKVKEWQRRYYEPKVRVLQEYRADLERLCRETQLTLSQLFVGAVEEKYCVVLQKHLDKDDK